MTRARVGVIGAGLIIAGFGVAWLVRRWKAQNHRWITVVTQ